MRTENATLDQGMPVSDRRRDVTAVEWNVSSHRGGICSDAAQADGTILVTGSFDGAVRFWGPDGAPLRSATPHHQAIFTLKFNRSGGADPTAGVC